MDGLVTADMCSTSLHHSQGEEAISESQEQELVQIPFPVVGSEDQSTLEAVHVLGQSGIGPDNDDVPRLLKSFDMIFQLHQRSEEIRTHLEKIDGILLKSRTVAGLIDRVVRVLEKDLNLAAARILIRADHPISSIFRWTSPPGSGLISSHFLANECVTTDPFVLDDPSGDLSCTLFGESATDIGSAAVAYLCPDNEELGLLCLASPDPHRYCGGMNTDLIASLAEKIALGMKNAWDHENEVKNVLRSHAQGILSEAFFLEYLAKEFDRAWRNRRPFSLVAMSWSSCEPGCPVSEEVTELVLRNTRSADVAAQGDTVRFWILLPDTDASGARTMVERLAGKAAERFDGDVTFHAGITEFSKDAPVLSMLMDRAKSALTRAEENDNDQIVIELCIMDETIGQPAPL